MKKIPILFAMGLVGAVTLCASANEQTSKLDNRIRQLTARFEAMQRNPDKAVPADVLRKAQGIVLLERTKAGFGFAFQGGNGVAMVKDARGNWGPPAFLSAKEASLGPQIGGEQDFCMVLFMDNNAARELAGSMVNFGGEARATAGDQSSGVEDPAVPNNPVLTYDEHAGFYGGAAMKGGTIAPDQNANDAYYGRYVTMDDILFGKKVKPTEAAAGLAQKIRTYSED